jgi:molybdenum cofactor biosynthesis protein B
VSAEAHRRYALSTLGFAVLTVSDSRTLAGGGAAADDASGRAIAALVTAAGHRVIATGAVPDEVIPIRAELEAFLALAGVDCVVATGGTGFAPRDVTLEAAMPLFERPIEGFGELFRMLSYQQVGAAAMLSRATAGLCGDRALYLLPGSPKAVTLAMEKLILPETGHLLAQARRPKEREPVRNER